MKKLREAWHRMWVPHAPFAEPLLEARFLADYARRFAPHRRVAILLGLMIDLAYLMWDYLYAGDDAIFLAHFEVIFFNCVLTAAALIPFLIYAFTSDFQNDEGRASRALVIGSYLQFVLYCRGYMLAPYPYDNMYFLIGMLICLIYCLTMNRLKASTSLMLGAACTLTSLPVLLFNRVIKPEAYAEPVAYNYAWPSLSYLATAATMGYVISNLFEQSERIGFMRATEMERNAALLAHQSEMATSLNSALKAAAQQSEQRAQALLQLKEEMMQAANQRNRDKSQFIAAAVHDLRQPVQAIGNALQPARTALAKRNFDDAIELIVLAESAAAVMRRQLSGILEISKLESGFVQPILRHEAVAPLLMELVLNFSAEADRHGVQLSIEPPGESTYIETDKLFLTRILHNLIGNSIKYRDDDKDHRIVSVHAETSNELLILTVADNGIGIPEKLILHGDIYRPFFQANNRRREQERGVGLGLSIVRAMVDLLPNHRLDVQSHIGVATEFTLSVPLSETSALSPSMLGSLSAQNSQSGHLSADVQGLYVLYVDDDDHVRRSTCALLASRGVLFDAASDYAGAHEIVANLERRPDVLVTDLRLPDGRSGLDVIAALREQFEGVPTIVISAEAGFQSQLPPECVALEKPVSPHHLLDVLAQVAAT